MAPKFGLNISIVYGTGLLIGLAMVSFPASSTLLKENGLTDAQYGFIFIPQLVTAVIGAIGGGSVAKKMGLKKILIATLVANALSQISLLVAVQFTGADLTFFGVNLATSFFGLAFGLSAAPLNTYPSLLFPKKRETALTALHTILGGGLAIGPFIVGMFTSVEAWGFYPLLLIGLGVILLINIFLAKLPEQKASEMPKVALECQIKDMLKTPVLWAFIFIVILYSFAEGTFANWAIVYLNEQKNIPLAYASMALSTFWAAMAGGRLLASFLLLKISSDKIWLIMPVMILATFLIMPLANSAFMGILFFTLAGISCSAFFPISVDLVTKYFPSNAAFASSVMMAALMSGVGIGSFLIGALRSVVNLDNLYQISALYPALVLVIGLLFITRIKKAINVNASL